MFFFICAWINGWENNRKAGDLRRHRAHYDVTVMDSPHLCTLSWRITVYPKKCAHGFVVLCFVVVMQSFIMNSHEVFIHINQGCFAGTGAIVRLPQCQWSKPDGYGEISQCITTTKHSKAKTVCIFLGIYCTRELYINGAQIMWRNVCLSTFSVHRQTCFPYYMWCRFRFS